MGNECQSTADDEAMTGRATDPPSSLATLASAPQVDPCDVCCDAMPGYVVGDLAATDVRWMDAHTAECRYCRNELEGFQQIDHLLATAEAACCPGAVAPPFRYRPRALARYGTMESPLGVLLIAATDDGVCEIDFGRNRNLEEFRDHMAERGFDVVPDQQAIQPVVDQLTEYFQGRRTSFEIPIDYSGLTPFSRDVLQATAAVPPGQVATYSEIAKRIGNPGASRAVGNALGRNPVPIILPCHRIVPADRSIGNYTGGVDIKVTLLSLEGSPLPTGTLVP